MKLEKKTARRVAPPPMFDRIRKLLFLLKLKRELKMKINLTEALALVDSILAGAKIVTNWTPTDKDNQAVAYLQGIRDKLKPIFGADEAGGTEDLPQGIADQVELTLAKFEIVADES